MRERRQFSWPLNKLTLRGGEGHFHLDKVLKAEKKQKKISKEVFHKPKWQTMGTFGIPTAVVGSPEKIL